MSNVTPGNWNVGLLYGEHFVVTAGRFAVADCFSNGANARLVAAAPEMYGLLEETQRILHKFRTRGTLDVVDLERLPNKIASLLARIDDTEANQ